MATVALRRRRCSGGFGAGPCPAITPPFVLSHLLTRTSCGGRECRSPAGSRGCGRHRDEHGRPQSLAARRGSTSTGHDEARESDAVTSPRAIVVAVWILPMLDGYAPRSGSLRQSGKDSPVRRRRRVSEPRAHLRIKPNMCSKPHPCRRSLTTRPCCEHLQASLPRTPRSRNRRGSRPPRRRHRPGDGHDTSGNDARTSRAGSQPRTASCAVFCVVSAFGCPQSPSWGSVGTALVLRCMERRTTQRAKRPLRPGAVVR